MTDIAAAASQISPAASHVSPVTQNRMASGAVWMVLARLLDRGISVASIVVLARLLVPADFGLVAMATSIMAVLELAGTFSFDLALIRNSHTSRRHYDTAWTCNILIGSALAGAMVAVAGPAAWLYGEPRLEPVVAWLALAMLIQAFENVGVVSFRKDLRFDKEFRLILAKKVISFSITVPAAFILRDYWALVIGTIAGRAGGVLMTYLMHSYRPRLSLAARADLFGFGKWLVVSNALNFLGNRGSDFVVGRMAGAEQLGLFNLSYELANLPTSDLIAPVNRAVYPAYAQKAANVGELRRSYLEVTALIALAAVPAGTGIAAVADLLIPVMFGAHWADASAAVMLLSVYGVLLALKSNNHYVYLAIGRPRIATFLGASQLLLILPLIAVGSAWSGSYGAAAGYALGQIIFTPISLVVLRQAIGLPLSDLAKVLYRPVLAAALMFVAVRSVIADFGAGGSMAIPYLLLCIGIGVVVYAAVLFLLWRVAGMPAGAEISALAYIETRLSQRVRRLCGFRRLVRREE